MKTKLFKVLLASCTAMFSLLPLVLFSQSAYQNLFESSTDLSAWTNSSSGGFTLSSSSKIDGNASLLSTVGSGVSSISLKMLPLQTQADFDGQNWEWSLVYRNNQAVSPQNTVASPDAGIRTSDEYAWRFWLVSDMDDVQATGTKGYYITHSNGKIELRYRQSEWYTATLVSTAAISNQAPYVIRVARVVDNGAIVWRLYVDPFESTQKTASTIIGQSYYSELPRVYNRSTLVSVNTPAYTGAFSWDNINMYRRSVTLTDANGESNGIAPKTLTYGMNNQALLGFGLKVISPVTINSLNLVNPGNTSNGGYFGNGKLYRSADAVFSSDDKQIGTASFNGNHVSVTGLNESFNTLQESTTYYFLVADFTQNWGVVPSPIQFKMEPGQDPAAIVQETPEWAAFNNLTVNGTVFNLAPTFHWRGWSSSDWNTASNWTGGVVPGPNDYARVGEQSISNPPIISSDVLVGGINFGTAYPVTLTVNSGATLTVLSDISQERATNVSVNNMLTGNGSIVTENIRIDNGTLPNSNLTTRITSKVQKLTVNKNVILNTVQNGSFSNTGKFEVKGGKLLIKGQ